MQQACFRRWFAAAEPAPPSRTVPEIKEMTSNKAFSYVYTRTLPLRSQPEIDGEAGVDAAVADIDASATRIMEAHIDKVVDDRAAGAYAPFPTRFDQASTRPPSNVPRVCLLCASFPSHYTLNRASSPPCCGPGDCHAARAGRSDTRRRACV